MKKLIIATAFIATTAAFVIVKKKLQQSKPEQEVEEVDTLDHVDTTEDEEQQVDVETEPVDLFRNFSTPEKKAEDFLREFDKNLSEIRASADKVINDKIAEGYAETLAEIDNISAEYESKAQALTKNIREKALAGEDISSLCEELSRTMADTRDALKQL
jgi:hypothetical protein